MRPVMFKFSAALVICLTAVCLLAVVVNAEEKPALLLAEEYDQDIDLDAYWVSEKLDGVRAFWNGSRLISRGGNTFAAASTRRRVMGRARTV